MKKNYILSGLMLIAALSLASCAKEQFVEQPAEKAGVPFTLVAGTDVTKTTAEDLSTIKWAENDAIAVFYTAAGSTTYGTNYKFTISSADLATNTFREETPSITITNDSNDWYAFYPYGSYIKPSGEGYVSVGGNATQDYTKPMAHLAGTRFPLYGKVTSVAKGTSPVIPMKQAMSILKVHVTNNSGAALDITSVTFSTEDYDINGQFYIDFSGDTPVFTAKSGSTGKSTTLSVSNTTPIAVGASVDYYISVAPFVAAAGKKIKLKVNDFEREVALPAATTFASGKVKTLNFNYNKITKAATLPFAIDGTGGRNAYSSTDGLSASGLGSDYSASNSPYLTKFDTDGDFIQLFYDKPADQVHFDVKMLGGANTSYFYLTGSADGIIYNDIETFTVSGDSNSIKQFHSSNSIDDSYRYLRLTFKKGSNVGMGAFSVTTVSSEPEITADNIADVPAIGVTDAAWTYTVKNFSDDVEVKEYTGCVTAATANNGTIQYSVGPNYKTTAENGTIILQSASDNTVTKTITVTQKRSYLTVSNTEITIPADGNSATFTVTSPEFGYSAVASPASGMDLSISSGASGSAKDNAQTVTITSTTAAPTSGDPLVLGTINVYRNGNASDTQKKTITIKKGVAASAIVLYECGFETGFTTGTNYQSTVTSGPTGGQWTVYFGNFTTSSKISGSNSVGLRRYNNKDELGYTMMKFDVTGGATKVQFKAKAGSKSLKMTVEYSTDEGANWTIPSGFDNKAFSDTNAHDYDFNVSSPSKIRLRISIGDASSKPSSGNWQLTIDDIKITKEN